MANHTSVTTENFVIENCVLSYPHLFQPQQVNGQGVPKYSCALLAAPDNPGIVHLQNEMQRIAAEAFKNGESQLPNFRWPLLGANTKPQYASNPALAGMYLVNAKASQDYPPQVVDESRQPVMDRGKIYPGVIVAALVRLYTYNNMGNIGVGVGFSAIMRQGDGEPIAEVAVDPSTAFASVQPIAGAPAPVAPPAGAPMGAPVPTAAPAPAPVAPAAPAAPAAAPVPTAPPGWTPPQ